jgi:Protein of unknown function (DUF3800)
MAFIYLDESGDLGFDFSKKRTSRHFVVTFLFAPDKRLVNRAVKKTFVGLSAKQSKGHSGVLHAVNELPKTRKKLLELLTKQECSILTLYLDKKRIYTQLNDEKDVLYNFIANTLLDRILSKKMLPFEEPITLIASQRETNRFLNLNFKNYLESNAERNHKLKLTVEIKTPHQEKGLQAVDFVSWAIFRNHEYGDATYYDLIKSKITEESSLYPL